MAKGKSKQAGIDALRKENTKFAQKVTTNVMETALKDSMTRLGVAPQVWEGIHVTLDLATELKLARANVIRYTAMLARGEQFMISPAGMQLAVETLLQQSLMIVRQLVKAQSEVAPGAERSGDIRLTVQVVGNDTQQDNLIPDLDDEAEDDLAALEVQAPEAPTPSDPTGYGNSDE